MGRVRIPEKAKLLVAMLLSPQAVQQEGQVREALESRFGPIDLVSDSWRFDCTDYYTPQMGPDLTRRIVSFEHLIDPGRLAEAKLATNALEVQLSQGLGADVVHREVNLDAGYLTLAQMVLATTKSYSHRIYLGKGIYAEVTLHYHKGRYRPWPWTYPDYASGRYDAFLLRMRARLKEQLAKEGGRHREPGG